MPWRTPRGGREPSINVVQHGGHRLVGPGVLEDRHSGRGARELRVIVEPDVSDQESADCRTALSPRRSRMKGRPYLAGGLPV